MRPLILSVVQKSERELDRKVLLYLDSGSLPVSTSNCKLPNSAASKGSREPHPDKSCRTRKLGARAIVEKMRLHAGVWLFGVHVENPVKERRALGIGKDNRIPQAKLRGMSLGG